MLKDSPAESTPRRVILEKLSKLSKRPNANASHKTQNHSGGLHHEVPLDRTLKDKEKDDVSTCVCFALCSEISGRHSVNQDRIQRRQLTDTSNAKHVPRDYLKLNCLAQELRKITPEIRALSDPFFQTFSKAVDYEFVNQSKPEELCCTLRQKYLLLSGILVKNFFWISVSARRRPALGLTYFLFCPRSDPDVS